MRVAIIGGTGFIGSYLIDELLRVGHKPVVLVRSGSASKLRRSNEVEQVRGDIASPESLEKLVAGVDAVAYSVGILRENVRRRITFEETQYQGLVRLVNAARNAGVARLLLVSANGVGKLETPYLETKRRAEEAALASGMDVTVFRPSVVFGDPRGCDEIATQLLNDMIRAPIPAANFYSGWSIERGQIRLSPVHVTDLATAMVSVLEDQSSNGQVYTIGGAEVLTWKEMLQRIAAAVGRKKWILPLPVSLVAIAAAFFDRFQFFPVTRDQLSMLAAGNVAAPDDLQALLRHCPRAMTVSELQYLRH